MRLLLLYLCLFISHTYATPLKLATGDNYYPYADSQLPSGGWSQMVVEKVYQQLNQPITIERYPWQRTLKMTQMVQADLAFPYIYTEQRAESFFYSSPINHIQVRLFVHQQSKIQQLSDINNQRFCMPHGYAVNKKLLAFIAKHQSSLVRAKGEQGCLNQIKQGWSDIGFINRYYDNTTIAQRYGYATDFRVIPEVIDNINLYLIISKNHPQAEPLLAQFNRGLKQITELGEVKNIAQFYQQWLNHQQTNETAP